MKQVVLIVHNIRSSHNVGSLLRTADGLGASRVYLTGYTPYPLQKNDLRLPHIAQKVSKQIQKTSLGAEDSVAWQYALNPQPIIKNLARDGFLLCALEQTAQAIPLAKFKPPAKVALVIGSEIGGVSEQLLALCPRHLMIPMRGQKDSFNVSVAAALALQYLLK